jgi:hypothetical protein
MITPPSDIVLFHRDPTGTLIAVRPFISLDWTRHFTASGSFRLRLTLDQGAAIACGDTLDIELDGRVDFSGVVQHRSLAYRPDRQPVLQLEGLDLSWWLHQRVIVPPAGASHDEQLGVPAETAIRHYLTDHLLAPVDAARAIPVTAELEDPHSPPLGESITVRARYISLARQVERIAVQAGLGFQATRTTSGAIRFQVLAPIDHTAGTAQPVVFSPQNGTTQRLSYIENALRFRNAVYVLGEGSGDTRLVELVTDDADIAARSRRELALDARDASTTAAAVDAGQAELARQANERVRLEAQPSPLSPLAYRTDWDLGDIVTLAFDQDSLLDLDPQIDQRIESIQLSVDDVDPLRIECAFGAPPPDATNTLRRIDERTAPARFE